MRTWSSHGQAATLAAGLALAQFAVCQPAGSAPTSGSPILRLSTSATIKIASDELVADLAPPANAPAPVAAQPQVNTPLVEAGSVAGSANVVNAVFPDYSVQYADEKPAHRIAQQTAPELRGGDSEVLLGLPGRPQILGSTIGFPVWQVSTDRSGKAHRSATIAALKSLRVEATDSGMALGMEGSRHKSFRLDGGPRAFPLPDEPINAAATMAPTMPPPNATPNQQGSTAEVSAEVVMRTIAAARSSSS